MASPASWTPLVPGPHLGLKTVPHHHSYPESQSSAPRPPLLLYSSEGTRSCVPTSVGQNLIHMPLPKLQAKLKQIEILKFPR